jgi:hypothetical protein
MKIELPKLHIIFMPMKVSNSDWGFFYEYTNNPEHWVKKLEDNQILKYYDYEKGRGVKIGIFKLLFTMLPFFNFYSGSINWAKEKEKELSEK